MREQRLTSQAHRQDVAGELVIALPGADVLQLEHARAVDDRPGRGGKVLADLEPGDYVGASCKYWLDKGRDVFGLEL